MPFQQKEDTRISSDSLYDQLITFFKNDIENGRLTISKKNIICKPSIHFKGIVIWDGVPITDLTFHFDTNDILADVQGEFFTFMGDSVLSDITKIDELVLKCPQSQIQSFSNKTFNRYSTIIHFVNAEKTYSRYSDNGLMISITVHCNFSDDCTQKKDLLASVGETGIPIIYKDSYSLNLLPVSCKRTYMNHFKQLDALHWTYNFSAFVVVNGSALLIKEFSFIPPENTPENELPEYWETVKLTLIGDIKTIEKLKEAKNLNMLPAFFNKFTLLNYKKFTNENELDIEWSSENDPNTIVFVIKNKQIKSK